MSSITKITVACSSLRNKQTNKVHAEAIFSSVAFISTSIQHKKSLSEGLSGIYTQSYNNYCKWKKKKKIITYAVVCKSRWHWLPDLPFPRDTVQVPWAGTDPAFLHQSHWFIYSQSFDTKTLWLFLTNLSFISVLLLELSFFREFHPK